MDNQRFERGRKIMSQLAGEQGEKAVEGVNAFSDSFAKFLIESFGEIYTRPVLDLKQRELLTLSSLITQGAGERQMEFHLKSALNIGYTSEELIEVMIHCSAYAGFPKALNALEILQKILTEESNVTV